MADAHSETLVILLHGVGADGASLAALGRRIAAFLPGAVIEAPDGPEAGGFGSGRQWFGIAGVTTENRPARIAAARPGFDGTVQDIVARNGFAERLDRVALVGFSQGTMMSLDAIASGRWPVGAVVGFSGRLAAPEPLTPTATMPVLLVHGTADGIVPVEETERAAQTLTGLGFAVETRIEPGLGHTISGSGAERAGQFLAGIFAG